MTEEERWAWRLAVYRRTVDENPWVVEKPTHNAKQRAFLLYTDISEVFYGGAAGGGKTYASLMAAAQFVDVPGYNALLLREDFPDLNQPGAWIDISKRWWKNKASYHVGDHRWTFPSSATITFGFLNRDDSVYQYDTASFQFIGFDELTQHSEWRYRFMFGRRRGPKEGILSEVPLRTRATSNPGGKGHLWVKKRFIDKRTRDPNTVFVPATLDDNKDYLDVESYKRDSLSQLDPITRAQREKGDWDAIEGGRFKREWFAPRYKNVSPGMYRLTAPLKPEKIVHPLLDIFQTCDPAASDKTSADYTVLGTWGLTDHYDLLLLDVVRVQLDSPDIPKMILNNYRKWNASFVGIEGVGANDSVLRYCRREPMVVRPLSPRGKDKLVRATPAMVFAESGRFFLPDHAPWLEDYEAELYTFTGDDSKDPYDDAIDMTSYAVWCIDSRKPGGQTFAPYVHQARV